ncbi:MAG TPA: aminoglycoside phosphotransferase family protein [Bacillales bacterium]|nr:aminoglycoside phosphotransferase family protein [Bacillales bacterium]
MKGCKTGILMKKYGAVEAVSLKGGFTNATYLLKGTDPLLVAKAAGHSNRDILNERHVLRFLHNTRIAPKMADLVTINKTKWLISTFHEGTNGQSLLDAGDLQPAEDLFKGMGELLAQHIHSHRFDGHRRNLRLGNVNPLQADLDFVPRDLLTKSEAILNKINTHPGEWVLTHGDFGSHNILVGDKSQLIVIDWEWAEWFHPLVDLAWTCWNTRMHYPDLAERLNQTFLEAYQSKKSISLTPELLKAYSLYKLRNILLKMKNADHATQEKWIHRLEWTLTHEIL